MYRLIESIKLYDGKFINLVYHQQRVIDSLKIISEDVSCTILLNQIEIPNAYKSGLFKCRIIYDYIGIHRIDFEPYVVKQISNLKIVNADELVYDLKWENREQINDLYNTKGNHDDILIVKQGVITDTSYANVVFRKDGQWFTPANPLLNGTMRQKLISENKIIPLEIKADQLSEFQTCKLINALLEFDGPEIAVADIVY